MGATSRIEDHRHHEESSRRDGEVPADTPWGAHMWFGLPEGTSVHPAVLHTICSRLDGRHPLAAVSDRGELTVSFALEDDSAPSQAYVRRMAQAVLALVPIAQTRTVLIDHCPDMMTFNKSEPSRLRSLQ